MITYYSVINRLVEEYFNSDGITKEANILSAFFLMVLIKGKNTKKLLQRFRKINRILSLSIKNFQSGNKTLGTSYLKTASKLNEENLAFITKELGNLDPTIREALNSSINFDFKLGYIGIVEEW